jgi:orotidine-5'-phosphate decarboxylase
MTVVSRGAKLIVALDVPTYEQAVRLAETLLPLGVWFKVGNEALYGYGEVLRAALERLHAPYFVDAKLHDIPRTVAAAVRALVRPGVKIINVHALGGNDMMQAAVEAAADRANELGLVPPRIFAVTILTSHAPEELGELGLAGGPGENVMRLAALARDARCAGVVCSAHEVRDLKAYFGAAFETLCPGIRPRGDSHGDQKRVATPGEATLAGADYIVVGRPIVEARDPLEAARRVVAEIGAAHAV